LSRIYIFLILLKLPLFCLAKSLLWIPYNPSKTSYKLFTPLTFINMCQLIAINVRTINMRPKWHGPICPSGRRIVIKRLSLNFNLFNGRPHHKSPLHPSPPPRIPGKLAKVVNGGRAGCNYAKHSHIAKRADGFDIKGRLQKLTY